MAKTTIPYDIYESETEIVIIMPLGWVNKESITVKLEKTSLKIEWKRIKPELKDDLVNKKADCYWWDFQADIELPLTIYFEKIKVNLSTENILLITVPKYIIPKDLKLKVENMN